MRTRGQRGTSALVRGIVVGLGLVVVLATASAAQEKPAATKAATTAKQPTVAQAEKPPKGGMGEGIKVHGHWTIDIKNPDGTLASRHEIENELNGGQPLLAGLLNRYYSDHKWIVSLMGPGFGAGDSNPCIDSSGLPAACRIVEARDDTPGPNYSRSLILYLPIDRLGIPLGAMELSGSAAAMRPGSVGEVMSEAIVSFGGMHVLPFTHKSLSPAIPVAQGQIIQVKVVFSFS